MIDQKLLDESVQVFLLSRDNFSLIGEKNIKSTIQYTERDHLPEIEKDCVRLVFWEELGGANVNIDIPENIDDIRLVIDGNTFGCMDEWGFETFTDYSFISAGKQLDIYLNSESYGEQIDKVVYLINSSRQCEFIRYLDNNNDFSDEVLEAFKELGLNEASDEGGETEINSDVIDEDAKTYFINHNKSCDASSIIWQSDDYVIGDLEPYIYAIHCNDGNDLINAEWPHAFGNDDFKTLDLNNFQAVEGDNDNEYLLCFTALISTNLDKHRSFKNALKKTKNKVVAQIQFKKDGKPILDEDGHEEYLYKTRFDTFVEFELEDKQA